MFGAVLKGSATLSGRDADIPQVELESEGEGTRKKECSVLTAAPEACLNAAKWGTLDLT